MRAHERFLKQQEEQDLPSNAALADLQVRVKLYGCYSNEALRSEYARLIHDAALSKDWVEWMRKSHSEAALASNSPPSLKTDHWWEPKHREEMLEILRTKKAIQAVVLHRDQ
jgi:hypothetical protein